MGSNYNQNQVAFARVGYLPAQITGFTYGYSLGTGSTTVSAGAAGIQKIMFHNPGPSVDIYVCQSVDGNGNALTPGPNGGSFIIEPGGYLTFEGAGAGGVWLAAAASGSGNPLTVVIPQQ